MGVDYAWEKFSAEMRFALISDSPPQERLEGLISGVCHLQRESFPDEHVWDEFRKLMNETTKHAPLRHGEERVNTTSPQMSDEKTRECLEAAYGIFTHLAKAFGRTEFVI